ncbi:MAG: gamma-glutamyltransferase [Candidatus Latescibacter sp.]|nr:gamma-glutamyltransferase [Candidatus Latescibacter sp.]
MNPGALKQKKAETNFPQKLVFLINILPLLILLLFSSGTSRAELPAPGTVQPVESRNGMISSQHALATRAGLEVLREGGNAVDAAVTVGFALAVTLPSAGNLGGGGFMLVHLARSHETIAIDYREKAPQAASRDMYLDKDGAVIPRKSTYSYQAVGVPGTVAGLALALKKYGTIPLSKALKPAIELADKGFIVDEYLHDSLLGAKKEMINYPASMAVFFKEGGEPYETGERIVQKDLAWSLKEIARDGPQAFYSGSIAKKITADMEANGGLITPKDLAAYHPVIRKPVHGVYRGYDIYSMPPPSSGGVHLIQMLNLLEQFPVDSLGCNTPETIHLMVECMKLAYADRSKFLGDSDFVKVPAAGLTSRRYADDLLKKIDLRKVTPSAEILPGNPGGYESDQTTHYSVMDRYGNAVANTYTLNFSYGACITAAGTGILLNDEMDDFSAKVGASNAYGLLGDAANAIEPGKRMLSCMTPTIVLKDGKAYLVTGSPGGSRIITTTLQVIMNVLDHRMNIADATNAVRIHHQWMPDVLYVEKGLNEVTLRRLMESGYKVEVRGYMGCTQTIMHRGKIFFGAADPRGSSSLAEGY